MTVLVALRKKFNGKMHTVYGTDSRICTDDGRTSYGIRNFHKHVDFGNFIVLWAGSASLQHVLDEMKKVVRMENSLDARTFFSETLAIHKSMYEEGDDDGTDIGLIIITKDTFYYLDGTFVEERDKVMWAGTGGDCISAMLINGHESAKTPMELNDLAYNAIKLACQLRTDCGEPITVKEF